MTKKDNVILVANQASTELGNKLAERLWMPFTEMERKRFADGEWLHVFPAIDRRQTSDNSWRNP